MSELYWGKFEVASTFGSFGLDILGWEGVVLKGWCRGLEERIGRGMNLRVVMGLVDLRADRVRWYIEQFGRNSNVFNLNSQTLEADSLHGHFLYL